MLPERWLAALGSTEGGCCRGMLPVARTMKTGDDRHCLAGSTQGGKVPEEPACCSSLTLAPA